MRSLSGLSELLSGKLFVNREFTVAHLKRFHTEGDDPCILTV